jgi:hypothetical protein
MFRTFQGPSSGSRELRWTEVTSIGSVLGVVACMVSVWLCILTKNNNGLYMIFISYMTLLYDTYMWPITCIHYRTNSPLMWTTLWYNFIRKTIWLLLSFKYNDSHMTLYFSLVQFRQLSEQITHCSLSWILHLVTHFVDLAVEMYVVLNGDRPLRAETCQNWHSVIKVVLIINVCISWFFMWNMIHAWLYWNCYSSAFITMVD